MVVPGRQLFPITLGASRSEPTGRTCARQEARGRWARLPRWGRGPAVCPGAPAQACRTPKEGGNAGSKLPEGPPGGG
eukprot:5750765-Pyramimonas_sp.AAC.1